MVKNMCVEIWCGWFGCWWCYQLCSSFMFFDSFLCCVYFCLKWKKPRQISRPASIAEHIMWIEIYGSCDAIHIFFLTASAFSSQIDMSDVMLSLSLSGLWSALTITNCNDPVFPRWKFELFTLPSPPLRMCFWDATSSNVVEAADKKSDYLNCIEYMGRCLLIRHYLFLCVVALALGHTQFVWIFFSPSLVVVFRWFESIINRGQCLHLLHFMIVCVFVEYMTTFWPTDSLDLPQTFYFRYFYRFIWRTSLCSVNEIDRCIRVWISYGQNHQFLLKSSIHLNESN